MLTFEKFLNAVKLHTYSFKYQGYTHKHSNYITRLTMYHITTYLAHRPTILLTPINLPKISLTKFIILSDSDQQDHFT